MFIELERRAERSFTMAVLSPLIAIGLTVISAAIIFSFYGKAPGESLYVYFIKPLTSWRTVQELVVRATPLVIMGVGLSLCYISNNWNIGAEGQYIIGAAVGAALRSPSRGRHPSTPYR
jgi:general nucleoside transport system permease protein